MSDTNVSILSTKPPGDALSSWIREAFAHGEAPLVTDDDIIRAQTRRPLPYIERANILLVTLANQKRSWRELTSVTLPHYIALTHSSESKEVVLLARFLVSQGWLFEQSGQGFRLTGKGFMRVDELSARSAHGSQGFVAMWFSPTMTDIFEAGIILGIEDAGYIPFRVDRHEHNNKIDDEILSGIRRSKFLVADFTGHRGGVYFEAGFALGLGKNVFWTCRKNDMTNLHFDIRQYNCIDWETAAELRTRLYKRITGTLGDGPYWQPEK